MGVTNFEWVSYSEKIDSETLPFLETLPPNVVDAFQNFRDNNFVECIKSNYSDVTNPAIVRISEDIVFAKSCAINDVTNSFNDITSSFSDILTTLFGIIPF